MARSKVQVLFKSGNSIVLEVDEFSTAYTGEQLTKLKWTNPKPNIMFISLPDIEAIFEVE